MLRLPLLLCASATLAAASVDLYISGRERNRTLGTSSGVQYISDGVVNTYALAFPYMVKHNVSHITFTWINRGHQQVQYSMRAVSGSPVAVHAAVDIPSRGVMPHRTQDFTLNLVCTEARSGLFPVRLELNYTHPTSGLSVVQLLLKKHCLSPVNSLQSAGRSTIGEDPWNVKDTTMSAGHVFYVSVVGVCAFVLVIAGMIVLYFLRAKHATADTFSNAESRYGLGWSPAKIDFDHLLTPERLQQLEPFLKPDSLSQTVFEKKYGARSEHTFTQLSPPSVKPPGSVLEKRSNVSSAIYSTVKSVKSCSGVLDISAGLRALAVELQEDIGSIHIHQTQLEGTFGRLQLGVWQEASTDASVTPTAVPDEQGILLKRLKHQVNERQKQTFCADCLTLCQLPAHPHVCQAIAVFAVQDTANGKTLVHSLSATYQGIPDHLAFCYAHDGFGNLKSYLQAAAQRTLGGAGGNGKAYKALGTQELVQLAIQAVSGVLHLHAHRILHRDIAARNCVLTRDCRLQLCDGALSRDLFPSDYDCIGDNDNRPIKWMAPESIAANHFTTATDLWSLGVLAWELFTFGQQPFAELEADDLARCLYDGHRLPQPYNCPDELYGVIFCCWAYDSTHRPTFNQLHAALSAFHNQLVNYI